MSAASGGSSAAFYVTGGTLRADAPSYVERQADRDLFEGLLQGEYCYVLNTRQMGKSSLMVRTAARLREAGVTIAVLDLTAVGQNLTPEQWYEGLLVSLGQQLRLEDELDDFWVDHERLGPLLRWMEAVRQVVLPKLGENGRLVLFIDEIDAVRSLPFPADEFFAAIRECYNRRTRDPEYDRLTFCLLGVATPADLIAEARMSPFNIGRRIRITDFSLEECAKLASGMLGGVAVLQRILYWTSGQPYMTQRLCRAVAESREVVRPRDVNRLCHDLFLSQQARESDDHLAFVRNRLLRSGVDLAALLDLYNKVRARGPFAAPVQDDEANDLCAALRLSGIARVEGGCLKLRNRVYDRVFDRAWIAENMPGAELRRQREAFRRGIVRASGIAGVVLIVMAALMVRAAQSERAAVKARGEAFTNAREAIRARIAADRALVRSQHAASGERRQRRLAEAAAREAKQAQSFASLSAQTAGLEAARARRAERAAQSAALGETKARSLAEREAEANRENLYVSQMLRAHDEWNARHPWRVQDLLAGLKPSRSQTDLRGFEWRTLNYLASDHSLLSLPAYYTEVDTAAVAVSPDGQSLATSDGKNDVVLWNLKTRKIVSRLKGHTDQISAVHFSPDGKLLASCSRDGTFRVWSLAERREIGRDEPGGYVRTVQFSPDGSLLASCTWGGPVVLWDTRTRNRIATIPFASTNCVSWSPDGRKLAVAMRNEGACVVDVAQRRVEDVIQRDGGQTWSVAISPDGKLLATGNWDRSIRLWDLATRNQIARLEGGISPWLLSLAFSPDGRRLASAGYDGNLLLWDVPNRRLLGAIGAHRTAVETIVYCPDGRRLASASKDKTVKLWDVSRLAPGASRAWLPNRPALGFTSDLKQALLSGPNGLALCDLETGEETPFPPQTAGKPFSGMVDAGRTAVLQGGSETAEFWSLSTRRQTGSLPFRPRVLSDDRSLAVTVEPAQVGKDTGPGIVLRDLRRGSRRVLQARGDLSDGAFSPDKQFFAAIIPDGRGRLDLCVWRLTGVPRELRRFPASRRVATLHRFTPDSRRLVALVDGPHSAAGAAALWVLDLDTGKSPPLLLGHTDIIYGLETTPDSRFAVSASQDRTIRLWDLRRHVAVAVLEGHTAPVSFIAVSPDGRSLASIGADLTLRLWSLRLGKEVGAYQLSQGLLGGLRFSRDGTALIAWGGGEYRTWPTASIGTLTPAKAPASAGLTPPAQTRGGRRKDQPASRKAVEIAGRSSS